MISNIFTQIVLVVGRKEANNNISMLGTCFIIEGGKYIVTPRHVVGDNDKNLVILTPNVNKFNEYQDTTINECTFCNVNIIASDPFRDIAILKLNDMVICPEISLGDTDELNIMDELYIVGFPHCTEGRRVLTIQRADLGAKVLLESNNIKSKNIVINTQTRPGQSGSLIYDVRRNKIVAMLLGAFSPQSGISLGGINPRELHQTTHCISAEYILNMIKEK